MVRPQTRIDGLPYLVGTTDARPALEHRPQTPVVRTGAGTRADMPSGIMPSTGQEAGELATVARSATVMADPRRTITRCRYSPVVLVLDR